MRFFDEEEDGLTDKTEQTEATPKETLKEEISDEKSPSLIMVEGDYLGEIYPLTKQPSVLGRADSCDITLSDTSISRKHAMIERSGEDYILTDLHSTNGVFLNGKKVKEAKIKDGDKIKLGRVVLRFGFQDSLDKDYHQKLRSMAIRDGLTKIFNKRHFMEVLRKELSFATRNEIDLSLVIFDIDNFKKINDNFGHTVGDQILKTIARILDKEVRGYDIFARYGGEEFVFLLRGISPANTNVFAERVRSIVESYPFVIENQRLKVTISVGFTYTNPLKKFESCEDFIKEADEYLYKAKDLGKNRVAYPEEKPLKK